MTDYIDNSPFILLKDCVLCPRNCHVNRLEGELGYCQGEADFSIASICLHRGEEPAISGSVGICNIFFTNCNLQCLYCQNHQISSNSRSHSFSKMDLEEVCRQVCTMMDQGVRRVGFVSPSHFIPQMLLIINAVERKGYLPIWIYNSNGYDNVETLRMLEGVIDVYLPDLKYMDPDLAYRLSGVRDYPREATKALREMFRQKGTVLMLDDDEGAESGMIVRHLVLPGHVQNSLEVIRFLAGELSPKLHLSLMSQYYPARNLPGLPEMNSYLTETEYMQVVDEVERLGMYRGWIQDFDSSHFYRPDFDKDHPFE